MDEQYKSALKSKPELQSIGSVLLLTMQFKWLLYSSKFCLCF